MRTTTIRIRQRAVFVLAIGILLFCGVARGQSDSVVVAGESFDSIRIGKSTEADVVATYGTGYKLVQHREYSRQLIYKDLGLSFYSCTADPRKEIFVVEISEPAQAVTDKAVRLGGSTMKEVFDKYGKPDRWDSRDLFEYRAITFYTSPDDEDEDTTEAVPSNSDVKEEAAVERSEPADPDESANQVDSSANSVEEVVAPDSTEDQEKADENESATPSDDDESATTNDSSSESDGEDKDKAKDEDEDSGRNKAMREVENKLVRRFELVERNGLRQCDSKFKKD